MTDPAPPFLCPDLPDHESFTDPEAAVRRLEELYAGATRFLASHFSAAATTGRPTGRVRACYPQIRLTTTSFTRADSRLSFGHVSVPGTYASSITRPDLFRGYLTQQIALVMKNHGVSVSVGDSETPMPVHFAVATQSDLNVPQEGVLTIRCATSLTCPT